MIERIYNADRYLLAAVALSLLIPAVQAAVAPTTGGAQQCMVATDCFNPQFKVCTNNICIHKNVFPPTALEIGGVILLPLLLGFANNGGVGGGGLIIPVCIAMFGFNTIQSIALSNFVIFVGALVRYLGFSIKQSHPQKNATIVDYNLCAVMLPLVLVVASSSLVVLSLHRTVVHSSCWLVVALPVLAPPSRPLVIVHCPRHRTPSNAAAAINHHRHRHY